LPPLEVVVERDVAGVTTSADVELTFHGGEPTVGDVADALGFERNVALVIDGRYERRATLLRATGTRRGSVVTASAELAGALPSGAEPWTAGAGPGEPPDQRLPSACSETSPNVVVTVRTLSGPDAGREVSLRPGRSVIGSANDVDVRLEDPTVARRQSVLDVGADGRLSVIDLAPARPSRVDGEVIDGEQAVAGGQVIAVGTTTMALTLAPKGLEPEVTSRPAAGAGLARHRVDHSAGWTRRLHRPPPGLAAPAIPPVAIPAAIESTFDAVPIGVAAVVITLAAGGLVALVLHQPAFLLLGAVGAAGNLGAALWHAARRRARRRAAQGIHRDALTRFGAELKAHQAAVAGRLRTETLELADAAAILTASGDTGGGLWARPVGDSATFMAVVGRGDRIQPPTLAEAGSGRATAVARPPIAGADHGAWALVESASVLHDVPVEIDLGPGAIVGVVGPEPLTSALARSLIVQLAVAVGPAHLQIAGLARPNEGWLRWLPHVRDRATGEPLVGPPDAVGEILELLEPLGPHDAADAPHRPHALVVLHDASLLAARNAPARQLLGRRDRSIAGLVVAGTSGELPAVCTTVVEVRADGTATIRDPGSTDFADHVVVAGASTATARAVALGLAAFDDPERTSSADRLPDHVDLETIVGPALIDPDALRARWLSAGRDPAPRASLGVAADGLVEVDLVRDGPHLLVAGTTGSGKSELLKSLVAALATNCGPEHLAFILIDYKGGSAFDACARLPHVVGVVTDLDEQLAERALRSLRAELRRREQLLREVGVNDLGAYRATGERPPLARLVVVVDEFATLAADLPEFMAALVGVAQRGRSLGVHLVLATQRPAGAVSDDIRANTNVRIALRVVDTADSVDVIGDPRAAGLPRRRPGRALVRLGPGELTPVQIASVTTPRVDTSSGGPAVTARDIGDRAVLPRLVTADSPTALDALVCAAHAASAHRPYAQPEPPWLPPLPKTVSLESLPPDASGLVDDPDHQRQEPWRWDPSTGHLLCVGALGAGTTSALAAVTLAATRASSPAQLHVYVAHGGSALAGLEALPHVGACIGPADEERQARLLRFLGTAMAARASSATPVGSGGGDRRAGPPTMLVVVDQLAAWRTSVAERLGPDLADLLDRILIDGPAVGVIMAGGLDRPSALPLAVCGAVGEPLVFRLADPSDSLSQGLRPSAIAGLPPGRAVLVRSGLSVQLAHVPDIEREVARMAKNSSASTVPRILTLPTEIPADDLPPPAPRTGGGPPWTVPIGLADDTLSPLSMSLHPGDHVLVAGPARSGKSTALALLAHQLRRAAPHAWIIGVAPRPSPLDACQSLDVVHRTADHAGNCCRSTDGRPIVLLVDDAELVDDTEQLIVGLLGRADPPLVIAAGRIDAVRAAYGHWTQAVRRQRRGVLLCPQGDLDGDVVGAMLPRRQATRAAPGRGYLVMDGGCSLVQLAQAPRTGPDATASRLRTI
jgi:S-DNA-T family DNA segregation ATPase FtsK/SpoIIIE